MRRAERGADESELPNFDAQMNVSDVASAVRCLSVESGLVVPTTGNGWQARIARMQSAKSQW